MSLPPQDALKNLTPDGTYVKQLYPSPRAERSPSRRSEKLPSQLILISGVTPDNAQTVIDYIRQLTNINFIDTCLMFEPGHRALIVCINDARDAQFISEGSLSGVLSDPLRVEYLYYDTGKLDRNYFRLIERFKDPNFQAPIYQRAQGSGSEAEQSQEDLSTKNSQTSSLQASPSRKLLQSAHIQARINNLKGVVTKTPRGFQIHPNEGAPLGHSQSMHSLDPHFAQCYQSPFTPPPLHPRARHLHRSSASSGLDCSQEIGSPMNLARMSPSLIKMSPSSQISSGVPDFFNQKVMSQTQPFFPRSGSYQQTSVFYPQVGNLSTEGSYSGHSTPSLPINTMSRLTGHIHTHSASSSSAFDNDYLDNSGKFSNSSCSSNHRQVQSGRILAQTMIHPMGKTSPRPRLTHARSFQFNQTPMDLPTLNSLENQSGKSPRKSKKKKNKKTKSHGDNLSAYFPNLGKSENTKEEERNDKEETKRVLQEEQFQINIEKVRNGESKNTTIMFKNIPNKINKERMKELLALKGFIQSEDAVADKSISEDTYIYDYLRLPLDKIKKKSNRGFAFINLTSSLGVEKFYERFNGMQWSEIEKNSEKIVELRFAKYQGKEANEKAQAVENALQRVEI